MAKCSIILLVFLTSSPVWSQQVQRVDVNQFFATIDDSSEKIQVVNIWATWCKPCIKELHLFEKLHADRDDIRVSLLSLDMYLHDDALDIVKRFVSKRGIKAKVYVLDDKSPDTWMGRIDKNWSGAIPATWIVKSSKGKKIFKEGILNQQKLDRLMADM